MYAVRVSISSKMVLLHFMLLLFRLLEDMRIDPWKRRKSPQLPFLSSDSQKAFLCFQAQFYSGCEGAQKPFPSLAKTSTSMQILGWRATDLSLPPTSPVRGKERCKFLSLSLYPLRSVSGIHLAPE